MKLSDGNTVSSRSYYYLLDFNDRDDWKILNSYGVVKLSELNLEQYKELFLLASSLEFSPPKNKQQK